MATHSSVLSWRIPGTAEPGGLPSMGSHRVRHDWSDLAAAEEIVGSDGEERMVKKTFPAVWINKKCHSHLLFLASKCEWGLLKLWSWGCCYPPWWLLRSWGNARSSHLPHLKVNAETRLAPDSWAAYGRIEFSESRGLHLPIYRMLNSLTWYLIFDLQTACSLCCILMYSLLSPPAFLEQFTQLLRCCLQGLES